MVVPNAINNQAVEENSQPCDRPSKVSAFRPNADIICKIILRSHAELDDVQDELEPGLQACRILVPEWFHEPIEVFDCGL